jgi:hypothetical protein
MVNCFACVLSAPWHVMSVSGHPETGNTLLPLTNPFRFIRRAAHLLPLVPSFHPAVWDISLALALPFGLGSESLI